MEVPSRETGTLAIKDEYQPVTLAARDRMLRSGRWKMVYQPLENGYRLMLFDVVADPGCTRDLSGDHPDVTQSLWQKLERSMPAAERSRIDESRVAGRRQA
jgi:arylsulfatase A-like enzyme